MSEQNCVFCKIIAKTAPANIVHEDIEFIIFSDIRPVANVHYLIVPKRHISNAKELKKSDEELLAKLIENARQILESKGFSKDLSLLGFHWPPFCSISHLHLHVIAPRTDMNFLARLIFRPNSYWFVTPEYVMNRIASQHAEHSHL